MKINRRIPRRVERDWHVPDRRRCGACRIEDADYIKRTSRIYHLAYEGSPPVDVVSMSIDEFETGCQLEVFEFRSPRRRRAAA